jgi:transcriptional regulator with XRE-family HTH domain
VIVNLARRLIDKLSKKTYREAYVADQVRTGIAYQIRALREQRSWNQGKFSEELDKPQSVTSRLENPDYGKLSLKTLLEVASTFDVALLVRFVSFPEFLRQNQDVSAEALQVSSFDVADFVSTSDGKRVVCDPVTYGSAKKPEPVFQQTKAVPTINFEPATLQ